jgi:hypothetical protein
MLRRVILAGVAACAFGLTFGFGPPANAQTRYCWINAKTGTPVPNTALVPQGARFDDAEGNHASITGPQGTFGNYVRIPCPPPPQNANGLPLVPPTQTNILPGVLAGNDKGGNDTPDKPGGDTKTTDTKPTDTKTTDTKPTDTKTVESAATKTKENKAEEKTQIHIEFSSPY